MPENNLYGYAHANSKEYKENNSTQNVESNTVQNTSNKNALYGYASSNSGVSKYDQNSLSNATNNSSLSQSASIKTNPFKNEAVENTASNKNTNKTDSNSKPRKTLFPKKGQTGDDWRTQNTRENVEKRWQTEFGNPNELSDKITSFSNNLNRIDSLNSSISASESELNRLDSILKDYESTAQSVSSEEELTAIENAYNKTATVYNSELSKLSKFVDENNNINNSFINKPGKYTKDNITDYVGRLYYLANSDDLSPELIKEGKQATTALLAYLDENPINDSTGEISGLTSVLNEKFFPISTKINNTISVFGAGLVKPVFDIANVIPETMYAIAGKREEYNEQLGKVRAEAEADISSSNATKAAFVVGDIISSYNLFSGAMDVAKLITGGLASTGAGKTVLDLVTKVNPLVRQGLGSGANLSIASTLMSATQMAGDVIGGNIDVNDYVLNIAKSFGGSMLMGGLSPAFAQIPISVFKSLKISSTPLTNSIVLASSIMPFVAGNFIGELEKMSDSEDGKFDWIDFTINTAVLAGMTIHGSLKARTLENEWWGVDGKPLKQKPVERNYFKDLNTPEEIKKKFREYTKQYHPDLHPDDPKAAEMFRAINDEYSAIQREFAYNASQEISKHSSSLKEWWKNFTKSKGQETTQQQKQPNKSNVADTEKVDNNRVDPNRQLTTYEKPSEESAKLAIEQYKSVIMEENPTEEQIQMVKMMEEIVDNMDSTYSEIANKESEINEIDRRTGSDAERVSGQENEEQGIPETDNQIQISSSERKRDFISPYRERRAFRENDAGLGRNQERGIENKSQIGSKTYEVNSKLTLTDTQFDYVPDWVDTELIGTIPNKEIGTPAGLVKQLASELGLDISNYEHNENYPIEEIIKEASEKAIEQKLKFDYNDPNTFSNADNLRGVLRNALDSIDISGIEQRLFMDDVSGAFGFDGDIFAYEKLSKLKLTDEQKEAYIDYLRTSYLFNAFNEGRGEIIADLIKSTYESADLYRSENEDLSEEYIPRILTEEESTELTQKLVDALADELIKISTLTEDQINAIGRAVDAIKTEDFSIIEGKSTKPKRPEMTQAEKNWVEKTKNSGLDNDRMINPSKVVYSPKPNDTVVSYNNVSGLTVYRDGATDNYTFVDSDNMVVSTEELDSPFEAIQKASNTDIDVYKTVRLNLGDNSIFKPTYSIGEDGKRRFYLDSEKAFTNDNAVTTFQNAASDFLNVKYGSYATAQISKDIVMVDIVTGAGRLGGKSIRDSINNFKLLLNGVDSDNGRYKFLCFSANGMKKGILYMVPEEKWEELTRRASGGLLPTRVNDMKMNLAKYTTAEGSIWTPSRADKDVTLDKFIVMKDVMVQIPNVDLDFVRTCDAYDIEEFKKINARDASTGKPIDYETFVQKTILGQTIKLLGDITVNSSDGMGLIDLDNGHGFQMRSDYGGFKGFLQGYKLHEFFDNVIPEGFQGVIPDYEHPGKSAGGVKKVDGKVYLLNYWGEWQEFTPDMKGIMSESVVKFIDYYGESSADYYNAVKGTQLRSIPTWKVLGKNQSEKNAIKQKSVAQVLRHLNVPDEVINQIGEKQQDAVKYIIDNRDAQYKVIGYEQGSKTRPKGTNKAATIAYIMDCHGLDYFDTAMGRRTIENEAKRLFNDARGTNLITNSEDVGYGYIATDPLGYFNELTSYIEAENSNGKITFEKQEGITYKGSSGLKRNEVSNSLLKKGDVAIWRNPATSESNLIVRDNTDNAVYREFMDAYSLDADTTYFSAKGYGITSLDGDVDGDTAGIASGYIVDVAKNNPNYLGDGENRIQYFVHSKVKNKVSVAEAIEQKELFVETIKLALESNDKYSIGTFDMNIDKIASIPDNMIRNLIRAYPEKYGKYGFEPDLVRSWIKSAYAAAEILSIDRSKSLDPGLEPFFQVAGEFENVIKDIAISSGFATGQLMMIPERFQYMNGSKLSLYERGREEEKRLRDSGVPNWRIIMPAGKSIPDKLATTNSIPKDYGKWFKDNAVSSNLKGDKNFDMFYITGADIDGYTMIPTDIVDALDLAYKAITIHKMNDSNISFDQRRSEIDTFMNSLQTDLGLDTEHFTKLMFYVLSRNERRASYDYLFSYSQKRIDPKYDGLTTADYINRYFAIASGKEEIANAKRIMTEQIELLDKAIADLNNLFIDSKFYVGNDDLVRNGINRVSSYVKLLKKPASTESLKINLNYIESTIDALRHLPNDYGGVFVDYKTHLNELESIHGNIVKSLNSVVEAQNDIKRQYEIWDKIEGIEKAHEDEVNFGKDRTTGLEELSEEKIINSILSVIHRTEAGRALFDGTMDSDDNIVKVTTKESDFYDYLKKKSSLYAAYDDVLPDAESIPAKKPLFDIKRDKVNTYSDINYKENEDGTFTVGTTKSNEQTFDNESEADSYASSLLDVEDIENVTRENIAEDYYGKRVNQVREEAKSTDHYIGGRMEDDSSYVNLSQERFQSMGIDINDRIYDLSIGKYNEIQGMINRSVDDPSEWLNIRDAYKALEDDEYAFEFYDPRVYKAIESVANFYKNINSQDARLSNNYKNAFASTAVTAIKYFHKVGIRFYLATSIDKEARKIASSLNTENRIKKNTSAFNTYGRIPALNILKEYVGYDPESQLYKLADNIKNGYETEAKIRGTVALMLSDVFEQKGARELSNNKSTIKLDNFKNFNDLEIGEIPESVAIDLILDAKEIESYGQKYERIMPISYTIKNKNGAEQITVGNTDIVEFGDYLSKHLSEAGKMLIDKIGEVELYLRGFSNKAFNDFTGADNYVNSGHSIRRQPLDNNTKPKANSIYDYRNPFVVGDFDEYNKTPKQVVVTSIFDYINDQINLTYRYNPVDDLATLDLMTKNRTMFGEDSLISSIKKSLGNYAGEVVQNWLNDVTQFRTGGKDEDQSFMDFIYKRTTQSQLFGAAGAFFAQGASSTLAYPDIDFDVLMRGELSKIFGAHAFVPQNVMDSLKNNPVLVNRKINNTYLKAESGYDDISKTGVKALDTVMYPVVKLYKAIQGALGWNDRHTILTAHATQAFYSVRNRWIQNKLWDYNKNAPIDGNWDNFIKAVNNEFEKLILNYAPSSTTEIRPAMQTRQPDWYKMIYGQYQNIQSKQFTSIREANGIYKNYKRKSEDKSYSDYQRNKYKEKANEAKTKRNKTWAGIWMSNFLIASMKTIIQALGTDKYKDDKDNSFQYDQLAYDFGKNVAISALGVKNPLVSKLLYAGSSIFNSVVKKITNWDIEDEFYENVISGDPIKRINDGITYSVKFIQSLTENDKFNNFYFRKAIDPFINLSSGASTDGVVKLMNIGLDVYSKLTEKDFKNLDKIISDKINDELIPISKIVSIADNKDPEWIKARDKLSAYYSRNGEKTPYEFANWLEKQVISELEALYSTNEDYDDKDAYRALASLNIIGDDADRIVEELQFLRNRIVDKNGNVLSIGDLRESVVDGTISTAEAYDYLSKYTRDDSFDIEKKILGWEFLKDHPDWNSTSDAEWEYHLNYGDITPSEAIRLRMKYFPTSTYVEHPERNEDSAIDYVSKRMYHINEHRLWSDLEADFYAGRISYSFLTNKLAEYMFDGDIEQARARADVYQWNKDYPTMAKTLNEFSMGNVTNSENAVAKYHQMVTDYGKEIDGVVYETARTTINDFHDIKDSNGKTTTSRKDQIIKYLNDTFGDDDKLKDLMFITLGGYDVGKTSHKSCPWYNKLYK